MKHAHPTEAPPPRPLRDAASTLFRHILVGRVAPRAPGACKGRSQHPLPTSCRQPGLPRRNAVEAGRFPLSRYCQADCQVEFRLRPAFLPRHSAATAGPLLGHRNLRKPLKRTERDRKAHKSTYKKNRQNPNEHRKTHCKISGSHWVNYPET